MRSQLSPAAAVTDRNAAAHWDQAHRYTPAPRHRRRLLRKIVSRLDAREVLDAGCAQPFLIDELVRKLGVRGYGCDISDQVMADAQGTVPGAEFRALDLAYEVWPDGKQFDVVICAETLEHIEEWQAALANVVRMSSRHVLVTVPSGRVRPVDRLMGHYRHFEAPDITGELERNGCRILEVRHWGFPVHSAYRAGVERFGSDEIYASFAEDKPYTRAQIAVSHVLYGMFFVNDLFRSGSQLIVLAEKR
jgi:hypothetical protein